MVQAHSSSVRVVGWLCFFLTTLVPLVAFAATNCGPPPFVASASGIKPNVLILLDNSGSMVNGSANSDVSYVETTQYYGFFDSTRIYKYDNTKHYFKDVGPTVSDGNKKWGAYNTQTSQGDSHAFSGNWLNWCLMTRLDVSKTVLTGGRLGGDITEWVIVGSPIAIDNVGSFDDKSFTDPPTNSRLYYTPFHDGNYQPIIVRFYDTNPKTWGNQSVRPPFADYIQRTGLANPSVGSSNTAAAFVPLFKIYKKDGTTLLSTSSDAYNSAESVQGHRVVQGTTKDDQRVGGYYKARLYGPATGPPPQGILQGVAGRVRLGYMRFNEGTGPLDDPTYIQGTAALTHTDNLPKGTLYMHVYDLDNDTPSATNLDYFEVVGAHSDGGQVVNPCGDDSTVEWPAGNPNNNRILSIVRNINEEYAYPSTPLGEVLREALQYFKRGTPCYKPDCTKADGTENSWCAKRPVNPSNRLVDFQTDWDPNNPTTVHWDPFYYKEFGQRLGCVFSNIILLTDGDPTWDYGANPKTSTCPDIRRPGVLAANGDYTPNNPGTGKNGEFVDQIAYYMHTEDLRPELKPAGDTTSYPKPGAARTVTFFGILSYAGGSGDLVKQACITGGFQDLKLTQTKQPGTLDNKPGPSNLEWLSKGRKDSSNNPIPDNFFTASTGDQMKNALISIFSQITIQGSAGAVATVSQQTQDEDLVIRGAFDYQLDPSGSNARWMGHVEAYWPNSSGVYDFETYPAVFCKDILASGKNCWDAGLTVTAYSSSSRNVFTYINTYQDASNVRTWTKQKVSFDATTDQRVNWLLPYLHDPVANAVITTTDAKALIQWTRGKVDSSGNPLDINGTTSLGTGFRNRSESQIAGGQWILGDIIYSTPVVVGTPPASIPDNAPDAAAFNAFRASQSPNIYYRDKMVYVGGNDGMIHAFLLAQWDPTNQIWNHSCTDCGKEKWAYIPSNLLSQLHKLADPGYGTSTCQHLPMVDLAPQAYDVFINYNGTRQWRTVLIGGERGGGDVYFAIDVTDPSASDYPKVLWEYSVLQNLAVAYTDSDGKAKISLPYSSASAYSQLSDLPLSWSEAAVGRITLPPGVKLRFWKPSATFTQTPIPATVTLPDPVVTATDTSGEFPVANKIRNVAFLGGGFRVFTPPWTTGLQPSPSNSETQIGLFNPNLLVIDIETGYNIFQKMWPLIVKYQPMDNSVSPAKPKFWPTIKAPSSNAFGVPNTIPYALADFVGVDAWNTASNVLGEDGLLDRVYFGDLAGLFYSVKFNVIDVAAATTQPPPASDSMQVLVELRRTKPIEALRSTGSRDQITPTDYWRYLYQPVTSRPALSWERFGSPKLRVLFGAGKLDDKVGGIHDDFYDGSDQFSSAFGQAGRAEGSFYGLSDPVASLTIPSPTGTATQNFSLTQQGSSPVDVITATSSGSGGAAFSMTSGNWVMQVNQMPCPSVGTSFSPDTVTQPCTETADGDRDLSNCCNWVKSSGGGDCCESLSDCQAGAPCWSCVFDLTQPGERIIDKPLIAGGLVFFTSVVPGESDPCKPGAGVGFTGYLYALDYMCQPITTPTPIIQAVGTVTVVTINNVSGDKVGEKATIPGGIPSRPVLDSLGKNILIQKSTSEIVKIGVDLPEQMAKLQGWRTR